MHRSTKSGLVGIAVLVVVLVVILFLNMEWIQPREIPSCLDGDKKITCSLDAIDNSSYRLYGTKTTYKEYLKYNNISPPMELNVHNCSARAFYLFSRHATRYPNLGKIQEMMKTLPQLKEKILNASAVGNGSVCKQDIAKLRNWVLNMTEENDNQISESGVKEAEEIAQRFKKLFPSVLAQTYSPDRFTFEYTYKDRTKSTAEAFAKGLFGDQLPNIDNNTNDEVLMFHKSCKSFRSKCKFDESYDISEIEKVEKGNLMKNTIDQIGKRLGFPLTKDEVDVMYNACFSEYALNNTNDTWCRFLSKADLRVLEFENDIDDYYKDGYGNKINYEQACPVAKYMLDFFRSVVLNSTGPPRAVFHFTHSGAIKKVLSMLGLHRDSIPLTADAFCRQTGREWRSSLASPFAANLAFTLLECGDHFRVATLLNERPVTVSGCEGPVCGLRGFEEVYGPKAEHCDLTKMCCTCCQKD